MTTSGEGRVRYDELEEVRRALADLARFGCMMWPAFFLLDLFVSYAFDRTELLPGLAAIRAAGQVPLVVGYLMARRRPTTSLRLNVAALVLVVNCSAFMALLSLKLGGEFNYTQGVCLILMFLALVPAHWTRAGIWAASATVAYPMVIVVAALVDVNVRAEWTSPTALARAAVDYPLLIGTAVFVTIASHLLWKARLRLAEQDAARSRLFVNLSHDFRTPLAVINGEAELLAQHTRAPEETAALARIRSNAEGLADLSDQLLELARLDTDQTPRNPRTFDALALCREVAAALQPASGNIRLVLTRGDGAVLAHADATHVRRIVQNLVSNALRQVSAGGTVEIDPRAHDGTVLIDVSDDGTGIAANRRELIFERFASFDRQGGVAAGIGLPLARELAELNDGSLELLPLARTTFRLKLPARRGATQSLEPGEPRATTRAAPVVPAARGVGRVVIVEDSADMAVVMTRLLADRFDVVGCADVATARETLASGAPAAVVSDVMLPDGDGYELLEWARSRPSLEHVPFLMVSALGGAEEKARGLAAGASDYLAKPFSGEELVARVVAAVDRERCRRAALERQRQEFLMEVHDGVRGSLARALLMLAPSRGSTLEPGGAGEEDRIVRARDAIRQGLAEATALYALSSDISARWDHVVAEIRRDVGEACESAGLALFFAEDAPLEPVVLSTSAAHTLRRVAREAMTNVLRHAKARRVRCELRLSGDASAELRLEDDGLGFDPRARGRGLSIIERRAAQHGGTARYGACPRGGSFVHVRLPRCPVARSAAPERP